MALRKEAIDGVTNKYLSATAVAKSLGVTKAHIHYLRRRANRSFVPSSVPLCRNPDLIAFVRLSIERIGLRELTLKRLSLELSESGWDRVPSRWTLATVLKRELALTHK